LAEVSTVYITGVKASRDRLFIVPIFSGTRSLAFQSDPVLDFDRGVPEVRTDLVCS
jgi:hypothetical protein